MRNTEHYISYEYNTLDLDPLPAGVERVTLTITVRNDSEDECIATARKVIHGTTLWPDRWDLCDISDEYSDRDE